MSKEEAYTTVLLIGIRKEARSHMLHLSRNKRYTLTPEQLKWDKFNLTYKYSFALLPLVQHRTVVETVRGRKTNRAKHQGDFRLTLAFGRETQARIFSRSKQAKF